MDIFTCYKRKNLQGKVGREEHRNKNNIQVLKVTCEHTDNQGEQ